MGYGAYRMHEDLRDGGVQQMMSNLGDTLVESAKLAPPRPPPKASSPAQAGSTALPHQSRPRVGHEKMGHLARRRNGPRH